MSKRLYSWSLSPFAGKVRVVMAEKGVDDIDLLEIHPVNRPPELRALNPTNRVPVLVVDDVALRESSAICDYLDETYDGPSIWPSAPVDKARARGLMRYVDDELTTNFFLSFRKEGFGPDKHDPADIVDVLRGRLARRWDFIEAQLGETDGPWLMGGSEPTLADFSALPLAVRIPQWNAALMPADKPNIEAWFAALTARPSAAAVKAKGEPISS